MPADEAAPVIMLSGFLPQFAAARRMPSFAPRFPCFFIGLRIRRGLAAPSKTESARCDQPHPPSVEATALAVAVD